MKKFAAKPELEYIGGKMSGLRMNICGNTEAVIEGCRGVVEYSDKCIKLNTGRSILSFTGRGLHLKCMSEYSLILEGHILSIEYIM